MAGQVSHSSSSVLSSIHRKMSCISWTFALFVVVLAIIGCQSQTFQYSRGWTNGKRSGHPNPVAQTQQSAAPSSRLSSGASLGSQMYDDSSVGGMALDESAASGLYRIFPNIASRQDGKSRTSDYSPFLTRKLGNGVNANRKPPMWILGVEPDNSYTNTEDF